MAIDEGSSLKTEEMKAGMLNISQSHDQGRVELRRRLSLSIAAPPFATLSGVLGHY